MTQIDTMRFRIAKADHEKALAVFKEILAYQRSHPELYDYFLTRSYFMDAEDNPNEEIWMFIDEYDDRDDYWRSLQSALRSDPSSAENNRKFMELVVPGSVPKGHDVWTELGELRVEFKRKRRGSTLHTVLLIVAVLAIFMGFIWIGQGAGYLTYTPSGMKPSFMIGDVHWTYYGAGLATVGFILAYISRRKR